jgi:hypothetical protein
VHSLGRALRGLVPYSKPWALLFSGQKTACGRSVCGKPPAIPPCRFSACPCAPARHVSAIDMRLPHDLDKRGRRVFDSKAAGWDGGWVQHYRNEHPELWAPPLPAQLYEPRLLPHGITHTLEQARLSQHQPPPSPPGVRLPPDY